MPYQKEHFSHKKYNKLSKEEITRREFLKKLTTAILAGIGLFLSYKIIGCLRKAKHTKESKTRKQVESLKERLKKINKYLMQIENYNKPFEYQELEKEILEQIGEEVSPLLKSYLQKPEFGLEELPIDYLWEEKMNFIEKNIDDYEVKENLTKMIRKLKLELIDEYKTQPKGFIENLQKFENYLRLCIEETFSILDFEHLLKSIYTKLENNKATIFKNLIKSAEFKNTFQTTLLSLILTEVCYFFEESPENNKRVLEYILRKYGLRFLCSIPAIYDTKISFGPFQLTELVLGKEKDKHYPINYMNEFIKSFKNLPDYRLPNSIENLRMRQHFRAEILLLLYYLIKLFQETDLQTLKNCISVAKRKWFLTQLAYYLAGSHHLPSASISSFNRFLSDKNNIEKEAGFIEYLNNLGINKILKIYLERFRKNFKTIP